MERLHMLDVAKQVGNTSINSDINSNLDKLLEIGRIDKTVHDALYNKIYLI